MVECRFGGHDFYRSDSVIDGACAGDSRDKLGIRVLRSRPNGGSRPINMQVRVKFFGMLKEVAGRADDTLRLPEGSSVADLLRQCGTATPDLKEYFSVIAVALNQEYSERDATLHEGDEVALIPPVSGGVGEHSMLQRSQSEASKQLPTQHARIIWDKIQTEEVLARIKRPEDGAAVVFEGVVRNQTGERKTRYLDYEAYEPMALKQLEELATQAL